MHRAALGPLQDLDSILSGWWTAALKTQVSPTGDQRVESQRTLGKHWKSHLSPYRTVTLHLSLFASAQSILYLASFLPGRKPFLRFATICHRRMCRSSLFPIVLGLVGPVGRKNSVTRFQNQYGACYCLSGGYGCVTLLFDVHRDLLHEQFNGCAWTAQRFKACLKADDYRPNSYQLRCILCFMVLDSNKYWIYWNETARTLPDWAAPSFPRINDDGSCVYCLGCREPWPCCLRWRSDREPSQHRGCHCFEGFLRIPA